MQVSIDDAKTQFSELIAAAERGEEVIIARGDKPVVRLNVIETPKKFTGSRIGGLKDSTFHMTEKFDDPELNAEIARSFNGE
jgi:prevent-host-death family protein